VRPWAKRGTRPRQPADQRYDNAYLFGAICRARGVGAALALPYADADMDASPRRNLAQCRGGRPRRAASRQSRMAHHGKLNVHDNITPIFPPSRAPELTPGRERLAVSAPELALKDHLRKLRCHRRRRMRSMAQTHRRAG
jgi:hypothetical protein